MRIVVDARTQLLPISRRDVQRLYDAVDENRMHLRRFMGWLDSTRSSADIAAFQARVTANELAGSQVARLVEHDGQAAGVISLNQIDPYNRRAELGYWISRHLEGHGLCRRACVALMEYAFLELDLNRLSLAAAVENRRSRALAERLGFTLEGIRRESEWLYDHYVDHALYGLLRREFIRSAARTP